MVGITGSFQQYPKGQTSNGKQRRCHCVEMLNTCTPMSSVHAAARNMKGYAGYRNRSSCRTEHHIQNERVRIRKDSVCVCACVWGRGGGRGIFTCVAVFLLARLRPADTTDRLGKHNNRPIVDRNNTIRTHARHLQTNIYTRTYTTSA